MTSNGAAATTGDRADERPFVSVVIPVRDDGSALREALACLAEQTFPRERFEIVIGDDGCAPGTLDAIRAEDRRIRVVSGPPRTSYAARNLAVAAAKGALLAFCDSDCRPDRAWLAEGVAACARADVAAGEVLFSPPPSPTVWSILTIDMFLDQERNVLLSRGVTANLFVRRTLFDALGGFDETLPSGGDYDFVRRAVDGGATLVFAPRAVVRHPTLDSASAFLRKVWKTNRWSAYRLARAGAPPDVVAALTAFVPVLGVARARRHALRPAFRLQRTRLNAAGVRVRATHAARALAALYFVVAYVAGVARTHGWARGRAPDAVYRRVRRGGVVGP